MSGPGDQLPLGIGLRDSATFDNYFAGPNHKALHLLQSEREPVVFLWGCAGTGKTHLLQAACQACGQRGETCAYLPVGTPHLLRSGLLEGLESTALICVDDLHAIAGDADWEAALFHLFNRVRDAGGRWIAAADAPPAALERMLPDLRSRLGWGPVFQLQALSDEEKIRALAERLRRRGLELGPDVASFLLKHFARDMRSLLALAERLDHASMIAKRRLTLPFVRECIAELERPSGVRG